MQRSNKKRLWVITSMLLFGIGTLRLFLTEKENSQRDLVYDDKRSAIATYPGGTRGKNAKVNAQTGQEELPDTYIVTTDTRELQVPLDPEVLIPSWTITALHNHLYAKAIGAHYIYFQIEGPIIDGKRPPVAYREDEDLDGFCEHRVYGWRPAHFCKLPSVWHLLRTERHIQNLVFIDSDAVFRSPNISVHQHLDQLSYQRPFGVLTNRPWDTGPCSGYWFMIRGREHDDPKAGKRRGAVEDFILEWWNDDWNDAGFIWYDQATLRRVIGGDFRGGKAGPPRKSYMDRVVFLDEWAFELKSPDQLVLHIGHTIPDRLEQLASAFAWAWSDQYPLDDRPTLIELIKEIDVRVVDPGEITKVMPLPGEVTFG
ncbi:hypothetical protein IAT40_006283 [Kwoniella sp. CBS 6097]